MKVRREDGKIVIDLSDDERVESDMRFTVSKRKEGSYILAQTPDKDDSGDFLLEVYFIKPEWEYALKYCSLGFTAVEGDYAIYNVLTFNEKETKEALSPDVLVNELTDILAQGPLVNA